MKGFRRFKKPALDEIRDLLLPLMSPSKRTATVGDALYNHIFDLPGPRQVARKRTPHEAYVVAIFEGMVEIRRSLETLNDIAFLVSRCSYRNARISPERYLQFHVEAYLGEVYLLKERLSRFLVRIEREFKKDERLREIPALRGELVSLISAFLGPMLKARDRHIHEERLEDEGISRLRTISLLTNADDERLATVMKTLYRAECPKAKKECKRKIRGYNRSIRRLLDGYCDILYPQLFGRRGDLRLPAKLLH